MFFEQYSHEPYIAVVRHWVAHLGKTPQNEPQLRDAHASAAITRSA